MRRWISTFVGGAMLAAVSTSTVEAEKLVRRTTVGQPVAEFRLRDGQGRETALADLGDKTLVVVAFLGTECPLAKLYAPRLAALADEYGPRGVAFLAIDSNQQDSATELAAFARVHGLGFPVLRDNVNEVADNFGAERTPEVFVLDRERKIRYRGRIDDQYGFTPQGQHYQLAQPKKRELAAALDELLAGKSVSAPETQAPGCLIGRVRPVNPASNVTYTRDVAPILNARCVECHRPGQIAPFALTSYDEARGWAEMVREVVLERRMPPWHASPEHGQFKNDHRLSDAEIAAIDRWVEHGAPQGNPADLPTPPTFASGWAIPEPDQVLYMAEEPFTVPEEGVVDYQHFIVDTGWTEDKWLKAIEPRPGNPAVVHHILIFVQKPKNFKRGRVGGLNNEFIGAYAPGFRQQVLDDGLATFIPAGSKLVFQMHYTPNGSQQQDRSSLGVVFADPATVRREAAVQSAANYSFKIPPGAADHEIRGEYVFRKDADLISMMPHMHLRGKAFRYVAHYPDGREEVLLDVPRYDFGWQTEYFLAQPKRMPKGTRLESIAHFDNSEDNLNNPNPKATVRFGEQTFEEMMIGFFQMTLADQDLTQPEPEPIARTSDFLELYKLQGLKFSDDLEFAARRTLSTDEDDAKFFFFAAEKLREVLPQLDRVCISYVEDGKLRLFRVVEADEFRGVFRSPSTVVKAQGQPLAEFAATGEVRVLDSLDDQPGVLGQMARKGIRSSLHLPLEALGRRGTVNFWSTDAKAFPPEAVEVAKKLVELMLAGPSPTDGEG